MKKLFIFLTFSVLYFPGHAQGGTWTWVKGDSTAGSPGNIGVMGVTNSANYPDGRYQAINWIDLNGNFWIFGGVDSDYNVYNELWKYDPVANTWTWVNGPLTPSGFGVYGTMGVPSPSNIPGARGWGAVSWTDQQGRLWLHGGFGWDAIGTQSNLDDMWMYDISTNQWTWMQGSNVAATSPSYGTLQVSSPSNTPGARSECNTAWLRSDGSLWTFGGLDDADGTYNDMWQFNVSNNQWTWMSGSQGATTLYSYGTQNVQTSSNLPPPRGTYTRWQDANDNYFIFGGVNFTLNYTFNDVWKYSTASNQWTWIGGSPIFNDGGQYTTQCTPGGGAMPPARMENRTAQTLGCSNIFWTFGGIDTSTVALNLLNDLWNLNTQTGKWTWVSGSNTANAIGNYGTQGVGSPSNMPGARAGECMWVDQSGTLWVWGGPDSTFVSRFNDMWKFVPDTACLHTTLFSTLSATLSDSILCHGDSSHLTINNGVISSVNPATGAWLTDSSHVTFHPTVNTSYTVIAYISCGSTDTFHYNISVVNALNDSITKTVCSGTTFLFNGQNISVSGTYRDTAVSVGGCDSITVLNLNFASSLVDSSARAICTGTSIVFHGQTISAPGIYRDSSTSVGGCDSITVLTLNVTTVLTDSITRSICLGGSVIFNGQNISVAGTYQDTTTSVGGCDSVTTLTLAILPRPVAGFVIQPAPVGDSVPMGLIAVADQSTNADAILWQLNNQFITLSATNTLPILDSGYYCIRLIASSVAGCNDTSTQCIYVYSQSVQTGFYIPNAFTPNGDGLNDFIEIYGDRSNLKYLGMHIFDRWGEKVFDSNDLNFQWDGRFKGVMQDPGVFVYILDLTFADGTSIHNKGTITLIR